MGNNLDDILNNDSTQVLPSIEEKSQELRDANAELIQKLRDANDTAHVAVNLELLQQINDRLKGGRDKKVRSVTPDGLKPFDVIHIVFLAIGSIFGLVVGKIVAGILKTEVFDGENFDNVVGEISFLIVLVFVIIGGVVGNLVHSKLRK